MEKSKRQNTHNLTALKTFRNMGILTCQKVESLGRDYRFPESELYFLKLFNLITSTLNCTQKQTGRWSWFMAFWMATAINQRLYFVYAIVLEWFSCNLSKHWITVVLRPGGNDDVGADSVEKLSLCQNQFIPRTTTA